MNKHFHVVNDWMVDTRAGAINNIETGDSRQLGTYHLKLLMVLMQSAGDVITHEVLMRTVWEGRVIGHNSLSNAVHALRVALDDNGERQGIIKTIPKKGYLIESSCCRVIEREDDGVFNIAQDDASPATDGVTAVVDVDLPMAAPAIDSEIVVEKGLHASSVLLLILLTILSCALPMVWYLEHRRAEHFRVKEIQPNVYSNIKIYSLTYPNEYQYSTDNVYNKLKDSLYTINQQLQVKSVRMQVYFRSTNASLNYTFTLAGKCSKSQLFMKIYHWRISQPRLNDLIKNETQRKLNEVACD